VGLSARACGQGAVIHVRRLRQTDTASLGRLGIMWVVLTMDKTWRFRQGDQRIRSLRWSAPPWTAARRPVIWLKQHERGCGENHKREGASARSLQQISGEQSETDRLARLAETDQSGSHERPSNYPRDAPPLAEERERAQQQT